MGQLPRRSARAVDHGGGLRRTAPRRRRPRHRTYGSRPPVHRRVGRRRAHTGLHAHLAGPLRVVVLGGPARAASGAHVPANVGAPQHLRLRLLGAPDGRGPRRRLGPPPGACHRHRHRRDPHGCGSPAPTALVELGGPLPAPRPPAAQIRAPPVAAAAPRRPAARRAVDRRAAGGRRILGRHPTALGLLPHRLAPAGLRPRPPGHAGRHRRPRRIHHRGRGRETPRGVSVARLGHRPRRDRPRRRRRTAGRRRPLVGRPLAPRRGDPRAGRLGRAAPTPRTGRLGFRVRQRPLPRHRRHGGDRPRPATDGGGQQSRHLACRLLGGGHAVARRRVGRLRRRQHAGSLPAPSVLRLRRAHRPAERRRDSPCRGDARGAAGWVGESRSRPAVALRPPGAGRLLVRALGRQLRLRHRGRRPRPRGGRYRLRPPGHPSGRRLARGPPAPGRRLG